jgi:type VI secretion system lysozyme-like protein
MHYLFERLAAAATVATVAAPATAGSASSRPLAEAVAAQIQRIVATRPRMAGDASDLLGFGMLNVVDVSANGGVGLRQYARRLTRMIERFEPRLANVEVSLVPDPNPLMPNRLCVSGILRENGGEPLRVIFDAATGTPIEGQAQ